MPDLWFRLLESEHTDIVALSVENLGNIGSDAESYLPELLKLLLEPDEFVKTYWIMITVHAVVIEALVKIAPNNKVIISVLRDHLQSDSLPARMTAAVQLYKSGLYREECVDVISDALVSEYPEQVTYAAWIIVKLGVDGAQFLPLLRNHLNDKDDFTRGVIGFAINDIEGLMDDPNFVTQY